MYCPVRTKINFLISAIASKATHMSDVTMQAVGESQRLEVRRRQQEWQGIPAVQEEHIIHDLTLRRS